MDGNEKTFKFTAQMTNEMKKTLLVTVWTLLFFPALPQSGREGTLSTISYLFTTAGGLSSSKITAIIQDDTGFFWIGTEDGLNRFDGYDITVYRKQHDDSLSLINNHITALFQDSHRRIWVATVEGLEYYEPAYDNFVNVSLNQPDDVLKHNLCTAIMEDRQGFLWFASHGAGVVRYSPETGESRLFTPSLPPSPPELCSAYIHSMAEDRDGRIWLGSQDQGISVYDPEAGTFLNYNASGRHLPAGAISGLTLLRNGNMLITSPQAGVLIYDAGKQAFASYPDVFETSYTRPVTCAAEDYNGNILVGTDGNGVFVFDPRRRELERHPILEERSAELNDAKISCLCIGTHNYTWIGLKYEGVLVAGNESSGFRTLKKIDHNPNSLSCNYVTGITTDRDKDVWIATDGGGLNRYRHAAQRFTHYLHRPGNPGSLQDNSVFSVFCDSKNRIWSSTHTGGLSLFDRQTESFTHFPANGGESGKLHSGYIKCIREDRQGILWLGTGGGGLMRFDPANSTFRTYRSAENEGLITDYITTLFADSQNRLWIGADFGLSCLHIETGLFTAYGKESGLASPAVYSISESPDGTIWAGTSNGLNRYSAEQDIFTPVPLGASGNAPVINGIVSDSDCLWLSTNRGLICYSIPGGSVKTYSQSNSGVGIDEFLQGAYCKSPDGEVFFGGTTGLSAFYPAEIQDSVTIQKVYINHLSISNEPVLINKKINGRVILTRNINESKKITLHHSDKTFTLGFVAAGSYKPHSTVFACKLEGFDTDWAVYDYTHRNVTYTNLNPGVYTFCVKASTNPGVWGSEYTSLVIEIKPPLWGTWWAKLLYVLLAAGTVCAVLRFIIIRIHEKNELRIERIRVKQQEELNRVRTSFFTNISHEFRTPLTLIIGPLKRLLNEDESEERKKSGLLILRNAERLQHLINQILDLNRIEEGKMKLHVQPLELVSFVSDSISVFTELMRQKHISLTYAWHPDRINVLYDPDMLDKCLNNILYNAFKFTPGGGKVHVEVRQSDDGNALLSISDTGIGMSRETREHLFDRFFQGNKNSGYAGTGIGMHLTRSIIQMHKGSITVESEEGQGSCFYLTIRSGKDHFTAEDLSGEDTAPASSRREEDRYMEELRALTARPAARPKTPDTERPVLLLIEDNSDMRFYIQQELSDYYIIEEAADGKTGADMALHLMPDLIITDIMMPEMSGTQLCRILKSTPETSHIPIIILTARDDMEHRLEGVESGADSIITKPFSTKYLHARIEKLIELRCKMKERFSKSIYMDAQEVTLTSMDERLLQKAIDYVRTNIEDSNLSVELMSRELGISRTHLHRKLKALTGQSPVEFIKMIRMKQAAYLLSTGKLSVSEVSYRVGYNTHSYFSRSFNAHFGMSPTVYMEKAAANPSDN
jgi:signal transduction histidine kinase/ligand-binding sensor domain-containing protein/DNA-binding response OmpR family regulator